MQRRAAALNTQTHLLLAAAVVAVAASPALPRAATVWAALAGALLPDASLFAMWGWAKLAGVPDERIWGELYYSDAWQQAGAVTNSIPAFALLLLAGIALARRGRGAALVAFAAGALLHVATDLPLHHDDGHPHLWPISGWIYASPVSYWDPAHHGRIWSAFEAALGIALTVWLWRRAVAGGGPGRAAFAGRAARGSLALAAASYALVPLYWLSALA